MRHTWHGFRFEALVSFSPMEAGLKSFMLIIIGVWFASQLTTMIYHDMSMKNHSCCYAVLSTLRRRRDGKVISLFEITKARQRRSQAAGSLIGIRRERQHLVSSCRALQAHHLGRIHCPEDCAIRCVVDHGA